MFDRGERNTGYVYFIIYGLVRVDYVGKDDESLGPGNMIGLSDVYDPDNHIAKATVTQNSEIYILPFEKMKIICEREKNIKILCQKMTIIKDIKYKNNINKR